MIKKRCTKCFVTKDLVSYYRKKGSKYDVAAACKECSSLLQKKQYKKTRISQIARHKKWVENNKERHEKYHREYRASGRAKEVARRWRKNNRVKCNTREQIRRAKVAATTRDFNEQIWDIIKDAHGYKCLRCGMGETPDKRLTIDHVMPLSKGGWTESSNIQPLCFSCNASKNDKWIDYRPW